MIDMLGGAPASVTLQAGNQIIVAVNALSLFRHAKPMTRTKDANTCYAGTRLNVCDQWGNRMTLAYLSAVLPFTASAWLTVAALITELFAPLVRVMCLWIMIAQWRACEATREVEISFASSLNGRVRKTPWLAFELNCTLFVPRLPSF
jgi:hypothetical protein